jgi:hypothetical protein
MNDKFEYKPTTAYWKIDKLIRNGIHKFKSNEQKVFVIEGGQGAGKTIGILMMLIDYQERYQSEITICSAQLSKLKDTALNDYIKIRKDWNLFNDKYFNKSESTYSYGAGHFTEFLGLDKADVGKGRRRKIVYINEANKIKLKQYTDITARADIVIIDFNPDAHFYGHDLINDFNYIRLSYLDNEFISDNEVSNILGYKSKGFLNPELEDYDKPNNIKSEYWANKWRVYGLGQVGGVEGRIFNWKSINYYDYLKIEAPIIYGVDWGKQDPFAIIEAKYYDGQLYVHELNYKSENEWHKSLSTTQLKQIVGRDGDGFVTWIFERLDIPKNAQIVCDSNRPDKIISLRRAGWEYAVAVSGTSKSILDGIDLLHNLDVYYTDTSTNIDYEQRVYQWDVDKNENPLEKPKDENNHTIDAIKYLARYWQKKGLIKKV